MAGLEEWQESSAGQTNSAEFKDTNVHSCFPGRLEALGHLAFHMRSPACHGGIVVMVVCGTGGIKGMPARREDGLHHQVREVRIERGRKTGLVRGSVCWLQVKQSHRWRQCI